MSMQEKDELEILNAVTNLADSKMSCELVKKYDIVYAICGIYPR